MKTSLSPRATRGKSHLPIWQTSDSKTCFFPSVLGKQFSQSPGEEEKTARKDKG